MEPMEPMKFEAASFNVSSATSFVPKGKMVKTKEEFPDLADAFGDDDKPKKKAGGKKGAKKVVKKVVVEEEVVDDSVPWKG